MDAQSRANELIDDANAHLAAGRIHRALPLYREAATLFPRYASFELVAADELYALGRREEAADSYRRVVAGVPEHEQAWESLALVLYELARVEQADPAMMRHNALKAARKHGHASDAIRRYREAADIGERADAAGELLDSLDDGAAEVLHDFLVRSRRAEAGPGRDFAGLQAGILVRFGMADFVFWYSDGPAPDHSAIRADIDEYLSTHLRPPPPELQQPVSGSPPPDHVLRMRQRRRQPVTPGPVTRLRARFQRPRSFRSRTAPS